MEGDSARGNPFDGSFGGLDCGRHRLAQAGATFCWCLPSIFWGGRQEGQLLGEVGVGGEQRRDRCSDWWTTLFARKLDLGFQALSGGGSAFGSGVSNQTGNCF